MLYKNIFFSEKISPFNHKVSSVVTLFREKIAVLYGEKYRFIKIKSVINVVIIIIYFILTSSTDPNVNG
jgi:hypothetical protein